MPSRIVKTKLESMKAQEGSDSELITILNDSNESNEDGKETARKLIELMSKRYVENQENHS
ncbi:MAG: hypothetical protein ACTSRU_15120 [Candidatus Hodarchaeales archaeon]